MSSSLPGGPSAKAGLVYEGFYGIRAMLSILLGSAEAINIEPPREDGWEFFVEADQGRQYWQVKRQSIGQTWTLWRMHSDGILQSFLEKLRKGYFCYFASMTDAQELRLLAENARNANGFLGDFKSGYLNNDQKRLFKQLLKYWGGVSESEALDMLQRIYFEGGQERTLETDLIHMMKALFDVPPEIAHDCLFRLYLEGVHRRLDREQILSNLMLRNINVRVERIESLDIKKLSSITAQYAAGQKAKLIGGKMILRGVAQTITQKLSTAASPVDLALAGGAGGGKSACLLQVIEQLQNTGTPVLAFRLDTLKPCGSTIQLGEQLGLHESPVVIFARAFARKRAVIIIDQLDVVSSASGRHPEFFDTVARLAEEVRGSRLNCQLSVLMACREFDLSNDPRLRRLFMSDQWLHNLGFLSTDEVTTTVAENGGTSNSLTKGQVELLQLPQNLYLFVESGLVRRSLVQFKSQKDLLDLYWGHKTNELFKLNSHWLDAFNLLSETLSQEMSDAQQLSVPRSKLRSFPPALLDAACSAGILTVDNGRVAFLHESLFDYLFARSATAKVRDFNSVLERDSQLLFRRAQLRQILVFLRDGDFPRYLATIDNLLRNPKIRFHLKLLTLQLISSMPGVTTEEFAIFLPLIQQEIAHRRLNSKNSEPLSRQAFEQFFHSNGLFLAADKIGCLTEWLYSDELALQEFMAAYLRRQCQWHANRVAQLLAPLEANKDWNDRFRFIFQWGALNIGAIEEGRDFLDSFFRALNRGVLDEVRGSPSSEDFFLMFHGLGKSKPELYGEIASHWLRRQIQKGLSAAGNHDVEIVLGGHGHFDDLIESAKGAPESFLNNVLPLVLKAAELTAYGPRKYRRDSIWDWRHTADLHSLKDAYLNACEIALESLAEKGGEGVRPFITVLESKMLDVANALLLSTYGARPDLFADEAVQAILSDPERVYAGYSNSPLWTSRTMIEKCAKHCSEELFAELENMLLRFVTPREKQRDARDWRGESTHTLLSALPSDRIRLGTKLRLEALESKLGGVRPPRGVRSYEVVSPIGKEAAEKMNDVQWLKAIAKYNGAYRDFTNPQKGGAVHLAAMLQDFVKVEPERFGTLALRFPEDTDPHYFMNVLYGLKNSSASFKLKVEVLRRSLRLHEDFCAWSALDLLSSLGAEELPADMINFVARIATVHPDPDGYEEKDLPPSRLSTAGLNTLRGHAVSTIAALIRERSEYVAKFDASIEDIVTDGSLSVRAAAMVIIFSVTEEDPSKAKTWFHRLIGCHVSLLATDNCQVFLRNFFRDEPEFVRPYLSRMIGSENEEVQEAGGRLIALAYLFHTEFQSLVQAAIDRGSAARLGVARIASRNVLYSECREWCERMLILFFDDTSSEIRKTAAHCFSHLWHADVSLVEYETVISRFLNSGAFADDPTYLVHALEETKQRLPQLTFRVCEAFIERCGEQARDLRTAIAADERTIARLIFRLYAEASAETQVKALDLIDKMCEQGFATAAKGLAEYDR